MVLDAVYSPHWLTADCLLLAGQHQGFADVNDNEVTSSGRCLLLSTSVTEQFVRLRPKPWKSPELRQVLQATWDKLPDEIVLQSVPSFQKRFPASIKANGRRVEQLLI